MPQVLKTLSQLLEAGRPIITADDLSSLDEATCDALMDQKVLVPARSATHVVCDACHDDHVEEVVRIKDAKGIVSFRIACPDAGWVDVSADRLRQWTIDIRRLVALLGESVGAGVSTEELISGRAWRIGNVEVAGEMYGVAFICTGPTADDALLEQVSRKLAPGKTILVAVSDQADANGFAAAIELSSAFALIGGRLELQTDRIRSSISTGATTNGNVFQRRGEMWQISFGGMTTNLKDSVGLGYIARLLMEPNRDIPAVTLLAARAGIDPLVPAGSSGEILTEETRENYRRRYQDLQDDMQEAKENNDLGLIEKLENEQEALTNELASATGIGGRGRQKSDAEKVRKSVSEAVRRDIGRVTKKHGPLGKHLTVTIASGTTLRYSPERQMDWLT